MANNKKILVYFIHGLNGSPKSWKKFVNTIRRHKTTFNCFDYKYFDYETGLFKSFKGRLPSINSIVDELKYRIDKYSVDYDEIVLVAHSMGGVIAKRFLTNCIKFRQKTKVKSIILYATPNIGSVYANIWGRLLFLNRQVKILQVGSDFLDNLNQEWFYFKVYKFIRTIYVYAGKDMLVPSISSQNVYADEAKRISNSKKGHLNLIKPEKLMDVSASVFIDEIERIIKHLDEDSREDEEEEEDWDEVSQEED